MLGIKYPQPKSSAESAPGGLRPDSYGNRTPIVSSTSGGLRPDSYGSRTPPTTPTSRGTPLGLLREPGSILNINCR